MSRNVQSVRSIDQVVEIRAHSNGGEILSHINYGHLERVRTARSRLNTVTNAVSADAKRLGLFGRRLS